MATPNKNLRKAAILLRSLPQGQSEELLGRLEPEGAAAVAAEMADLQEIDDAERQSVVLEFAGANAARPVERPATVAPPFQFLYDLKADAIVELIGEERPQTIALVLCCLPPRVAAAVLEKLAPAEQFSVVCRIAALGEPAPEILQDVETQLYRRLVGGERAPAGRRGLSGVVKILNALEPAIERRLLGELSETDPQLAREIRREMFGPDVAACADWGVAGAAC
jgi:flagellar motor switch protein FliG